MNAKLSPHLVDLVYDALVKSFWRKRALRAFLRRAGIAEDFLARLDEGEGKRAWLDRLFPRLEAAEEGPAVILRMARTLAEQREFPDLDHWEDSAARIRTATAAVAALRRQLAARDEDRARDRARERAAAIREASVRSEADRERLRERLDALAPLLGTYAGGIAFADWFYDLMEFSGVEYRPPYHAAGRQIDGSVTIEGTTYLVALKFTASRADATEIDSLLAKVRARSDDAMGLMVSMSGYSSPAGEREPPARVPLLLLDSGHLYLVLSAVQGFPEVVRRVRRHASRTGRAYLPAAEFAGPG